MNKTKITLGDKVLESNVVEIHKALQQRNVVEINHLHYSAQSLLHTRSGIWTKKIDSTCSYYEHHVHHPFKDSQLDSMFNTFLARGILDIGNPQFSHIFGPMGGIQLSPCELHREIKQLYTAIFEETLAVEEALPMGLGYSVTAVLASSDLKHAVTIESIPRAGRYPYHDLFICISGIRIPQLWQRKINTSNS